MTLAARVEGDLRVAGNLTVDGSMPTIPRSSLKQDAASKFVIPMVHFRVHDALATVLPGTSANDDLGLYGGTFGTDSPYISTGDVKASSVTRYARTQVALPAEYDAAETLTLRFSAGMETTAADTSAVLDVECYKADRETGAGSDICGTNEQNINDTDFADYDFTITPTGLTAGDVLDIRIKIAVVDGATGTAVIASIGAIELLADIKG